MGELSKIVRGGVTVKACLGLVLVLACLLCVPAQSADSGSLVDLGVSISGPRDGQIGDVLEYTFRVSNGGPDAAAGATLSIEFDGISLEYMGTDVVCDYVPENSGSSSTTCPINLPAGGQTVVHVQFRVVGRTSVTIFAGVDVVQSQQADPNPGNNAQQLQVFPPSSISSIGPPTISGSPTVGSTISATQGTWSPPAWPYTYTYHWNRCAPSPGPCATLNGGQTYYVTDADAGCALQVVVTASSGSGSSNAVSAATAPVPGGPCVPGPVQQPPPVVAPPGPVAVKWVAALPHAIVNHLYNAPLAVDPPSGFSAALHTGRLPYGIYITPSGGLSGVPVSPGSLTFTVNAVFDNFQSAASPHQFTLVIDNAPSTQTVVRASAALTPGSLDSHVTQATIRSTICSPAWRTRAQPTVGFLRKLKSRQMRQYHDVGPASAYAEDALVPVGLGGSASAPANLWPEQLSLAKRRDLLEQNLNRKVCSGMTTLRAAQQQIIGLKRRTG